MTRKDPTPEMSAIQMKARKWARTKGPAAIKRAVELSNRAAERMRDAQGTLQFPRW